MTDRHILTNAKCACKAEHWQPHAESCPAYKPKPLLTRDEWTMKGELSIRGPSYSPTPFESRWVRAEWADAEIERLLVIEKLYGESCEKDYDIGAARLEIEQLRNGLEKIALGGHEARMLVKWANEALRTETNAHEPLPCASLPTSNPDCPKCHGAGWVYGTQLENPSFDTQMDTMTHYTCDSAECNPEQSQGASRDASSEKAVK